MPLDFIYEKKAQHLVLDLVICHIPETKIALVDEFNWNDLFEWIQDIVFFL